MLIYRSADGSIKIDVRMGEETVWLTQDQMAALFGKAKSTINEHLKNIFSEGELVADSVIRNFRTTAADGKGYDTKLLQPRRDYFGRLPREIAPRHAVPHLGDAGAARIPHQGLRTERRTDEVGQVDELFRRIAGAHPRNPPFGTGVLPKGQGHLHDEHRLRPES